MSTLLHGGCLDGTNRYFIVGILMYMYSRISLVFLCVVLEIPSPVSTVNFVLCNFNVNPKQIHIRLCPHIKVVYDPQCNAEMSCLLQIHNVYLQ